MGQSIQIDNIEELHWRLRIVTLTAIHGEGAPITNGDGIEPVRRGVAKVESLLQRDVEIDLLRVAGRRGRSSCGAARPASRFTPRADHNRLESIDRGDGVAAISRIVRRCVTTPKNGRARPSTGAGNSIARGKIGEIAVIGRILHRMRKAAGGLCAGAGDDRDGRFRRLRRAHHINRPQQARRIDAD